MSKFIALACLILFSQSLSAQSNESENPTPAYESAGNNIGFGAGLDYGGFGIRYTYMTSPKFGVFGSLGYVLVGAGFNFGFNVKFPSNKRATPVLTAMYGYNAAIKVEGGSQYDKIYYGPSAGFGVEVKNRRNKKNFWNFELLVPIRSNEYRDDMDALTSNPDIEMSEALPITFSIGYHIGLN